MKRLNADRLNLQTLLFAMVLVAKLKTATRLSEDQDGEHDSQAEEAMESGDFEEEAEQNDEFSQGLVDPARTRVVDPARTRVVDPARTGTVDPART